MTKNCVQCQAENLSNANFCSRCGRSFGEALIRSATAVSPLMLLWRQLSPSLTRKEVRKLLGEPLRVELAAIEQAEKNAVRLQDAAIETWTYVYVAADRSGLQAAGQVFLSVLESRVVGWTEPNWESFSNPGAPLKM